MENDKLALIHESEMSLVSNNSLNAEQMQLLLKRTPQQYVKKRPAKGGGQWNYVTGGYVRKCLNLMFGWDWDFEIVNQQVIHGEAIVQGRLTCRTNGKTIVKTQFGNKDIILKKGTETPLSIGNDLKAAATDCLKKCAAEIGIAADIYNKEDFKEVQIDTNPIDFNSLKQLYDLKKEQIPSDEQINIERILNNEEKRSFKKLKTYLSAL